MIVSLVFGSGFFVWPAPVLLCSFTCVALLYCINFAQQLKIFFFSEMVFRALVFLN